MLTELSKQVYAGNVGKGFYDDDRNIGEMLALIHSEVSEALECDRKGLTTGPDTVRAMRQVPDETWVSNFKRNVKDTFEDELADIIIRVLDLAAYRNIDIGAHVEMKLRYNKTRPYKHGKKY